MNFEFLALCISISDPDSAKLQTTGSVVLVQGTVVGIPTKKRFTPPTHSLISPGARLEPNQVRPRPEVQTSRAVLSLQPTSGVSASPNCRFLWLPLDFWSDAFQLPLISDVGRSTWAGSGQLNVSARIGKHHQTVPLCNLFCFSLLLQPVPECCKETATGSARNTAQ